MNSSIKTIGKKSMFCKSKKKKYLILDWDLCLHLISTPAEKVAKDVYNILLKKYGIEPDQEQVYMINLHHFFSKLVEKKLRGELEFAIVTRNSYENVKWFLKYRMGITFPIDILSQPKVKNPSNKDDKPILNDKFSQFVEYFKLDDMKINICIVDDGEEEHVSAAYSAKMYENISLSHVKVKRPPRGVKYDETWGLMNQPEAVDKLNSFMKKKKDTKSLNDMIFLFLFCAIMYYFFLSN